jgi:hypothetical protein
MRKPILIISSCCLPLLKRCTWFNKVYGGIDNLRCSMHGRRAAMCGMCGRTQGGAFPDLSQDLDDHSSQRYCSRKGQEPRRVTMHSTSTP